MKNRTLTEFYSIVVQYEHVHRYTNFFHSTLGPDSYYPTEAPPTPENRLFGMFHHCSTNQIKEVILNSLSNPNGVCRIVFATVALGMGFSSQNIHHVIHYGIVEIYLKIYCQESGRAGRDGKQATAILLFCGCDLHPQRKIEKIIKNYCLQNVFCRQITLLKPFFDSNDLLNSVSIPEPLHLCCDICQKKCMCTGVCGTCTFNGLFSNSEAEEKFNSEVIELVTV